MSLALKSCRKSSEQTKRTKENGEDKLTRSSTTHIDSQQKEPMNGARMDRSENLIRSVVATAHILKTGKDPGFGPWEGTRSFAIQKAKAVKLSEYSFPVFLIRRPKQRGSYLDVEEGMIELPSTKKAMKLK